MPTTSTMTSPCPIRPAPAGVVRRAGSRRDPGVRPALPVALAAAVVPAYLFPAVTTAVNALVIPNQQIAARLAVAAWTTIAIPSAAAAALVTAWTHRRTPPPWRGAGTSGRAFVVAALTCAFLAGSVSAVGIGNGLLALSALQFTLTSAAIGGGLAARRWARTTRVGRAGRRDPRRTS